MSSTDRTEYTIVIDGVNYGSADNLATIIRAWDTFSTYLNIAEGAITVQAWRGDLMVREGNILRVTEGRIYLNPRLADLGIGATCCP